MTPTPQPSVSSGLRSRLTRAAVAAALVAGAWGLPGWAGAAAAFPLLGLVPGLAVVAWLRIATGRTMTLALAGALSPLLAAAAGWAVLASGGDTADAARIVAAAAVLAWLAAPATGGIPRDLPPLPRVVPVVAIALAVAVALPPLLNRYIVVRGDTWTHAGIAMQILERGVPPEDPRFAGITLHYPWFYNLFAALLAAPRDGDPFRPMALLNVSIAASTVAITADLALRAWRQAGAAAGAAWLVVFGLNAGAWLLWPLRLVKAFAGEHRGLAEVAIQLRTFEWGSARVVYSLSAPFAHMVSFLDKLLVGSPLGYGYLLMTLWLWALLGWLAAGRRGDLAVIGGCAAGMLLFHGVVGLSVVPVGGAALLVALVARGRADWLPPGRRLIAAGAATAAGALLVAPYFLAVATGWRGEESGLHHHYVATGWTLPWTLLTATGIVAWFAAPAWRRVWDERDAVRGVLALHVALMLGFALVIQLPEHNEVKFVWQVFVPALVLAAPSFHAFLSRAWTLHPGRTALVAFVLAGVPFALSLQGYLADPGAHRDPTVVERPGEGALYAWIRARTPRDAMVVDNAYRDVVMVKGRRALYLGTSFGPERAAFPLAQVLERRRVTADLYGPAAALDADVAALRRFGRPVYVVFRPEDGPGVAAARQAAGARPDCFEPGYDGDGYRVVRVRGAQEGR